MMDDECIGKVCRESPSLRGKKSLIWDDDECKVSDKIPREPLQIRRLNRFEVDGDVDKDGDGDA